MERVGPSSTAPVDAAWSAGPLSSERSRITWIALALACGIVFGRLQPAPAVWIWLVLAGIGAAACLYWRRNRRVAFSMLCAGFVALGAAWVTVRHHRVAPNDLAAMIGEEPALVRIRGRATSSPTVRERATGSMAVFGFQDPATYFRIDADGLIDNAGREIAVCGQVLVRCDEAVSPFAHGDTVEVTGILGRFPKAGNPGELDRANYARALGQAGLIRVPQRELVIVTPRHGRSWRSAFAEWQESMRRRASGWIIGDLPSDERTERQALLAALLLGERDEDLVDLGESFRRVGLAHLMAISGLHLGVLAGVVLLALRIVSPVRRWHGLVLIGVILLYVSMIDARMPVLRAAIMTCAASAGISLGRRLRVEGLVALSAIALLAWKPWQLFDAGFQLSYGVVLGLIVLGPRLRRRWFGPRNQLASSTSAMAAQWLMDLTAASVVAWAVATPLVAYHFGLITPLAAPASIVALPLTTVLLAVGYAKMLLGAVLPSAGIFLGLPLAVLADLLVSIVQALDRLPFSVLRVPTPSILWTAAGLAIAWWWVQHGTRRQQRSLVVATCILLLWLWWPALPLQSRPTLRIDMLGVGDGSCYVIRSGGTTVLFDAGSGNDLDAGRSFLGRALERLGVQRIDAIAISHANLDHFSAVVELAERFAVGRLLVTPQFLSTSEEDPLGPPALLLREMTSNRRTPLEVVSAGEKRTFGETTWTWLHPPPDVDFSIVNDSSMVVRIDVSGRSVLLTGDIQREAMAMVSAAGALLDVDVIELPHHGSYHDMAVVFVEGTSPLVVMQSTGWGRWERDPWGSVLGSVERLVTARDGACTIEIDRAGAIRTRRYLVEESPVE